MASASVIVAAAAAPQGFAPAPHGFDAAHGFFGAQGFFAAQGLVLASLTNRGTSHLVLWFAAAEALQGLAAAHGLLAAQGFCA
ncbi:MAG: hypothetical protein Q7N95_13395 [Alphaproteobacteria bacterium]|nr:hypothetical protein [Alphaproteobacteria bacterium]